MQTHLSTLIHTPATDMNFRAAVADAPLEALQEALEARAKAGGKTAFQAIRGEIVRRLKEANPEHKPVETYEECLERLLVASAQPGALAQPVAPSQPGTLERMDGMPAAGSGHSVALSDMSVDQLGEAFAGLEKAQAQGESMSGMCATLAGLVLAEVKKKVGHGKFIPWLNEHFPKTRKTSALYMKLGSIFTKCNPRVTFEQLTLALLDNATAGDGHALDFSHPLVKQVAKWTKGRSFYQLRQEELTQGGNNHPKCPHCEGDLASKTQPVCPHCGEATGQAEKTPEEIRAELTAQTREWAHGLLGDSRMERKMFRLLPDHEAAALASHLRAQAQEIEAWVKLPARRREEMAIEEVLG